MRLIQELVIMVLWVVVGAPEGSEVSPAGGDPALQLAVATAQL